MAVGLSATNLANKWLGMLAGTAFTAPAAAYVSLATANPGAAGTTAPSAGDASRKVITYAAASGGSISMTGTAPVWTNGGTSETLADIATWDASTAGNFLYSAALTTSQAWASTNTFSLTSLTFALTPIAA